MSLVAYFTAVVARTGAHWKARDVEVDDHETLDELVDALRAASLNEEPVLAVVEHEDEWFAIVRVDGDDEPRLFVSDLAAVTHSPFGAVFSGAADSDEDGESGPGNSGREDDEEPEDEPGAAAWAGDLDLLDDLGVPAKVLRGLVEDTGDDPAAVLGEVGTLAGFGELLEVLR